MQVKNAVKSCAIVVGVGLFAPCASADVVFSQPPTLSLNPGWVSNQSALIVAPFVATQSRPMTGFCFWARNGQSSFDTSANFRLDVYAEAPGGGPGSSLFGGVYPLASFSQEATSSALTSKYGFMLPAAVSLSQGSRYFLGIAGDVFTTPQDPFHGIAWVAAPAGETAWISIDGAAFYNEGAVRTSFEIKSTVIPLPSGAAMGFAGLSLMAGLRRRR